MYAIINNKVHEIEIIKESKRGTSAFCKLKDLNKQRLISFSKMYGDKSSAEIVLNKELDLKKIKQTKVDEEIKQISEIIFKIYNEFGIKIRVLDRPATIEEARKLYYKLKRNIVNG